MKYSIKRAGIVVASVAMEGQQIRKSLGEDIVDVSFKSKNPVDIQIDDTVEVYGRVYKLNRPLESTVSNGIYQYSGQFEALWYDLIDVQFRGLGATNQLTEAEFSIYATAYDIVDLAVRNANRIQIGWTIGVVDDTERYNFTFHGQNVKQALNQLVEVFQSEIWFDNKTIHFQKREVNSGLSLSYGKGNGLYEFTKANRTDTSVVTRLYVEGGSRNLPQGYGRTRLQLPGGMPYIQDADITKIIEHSEHFDNIIPERIGTITNVVDPFTFTDTSMDFDVNDHLGGMKAKIGFQTGKLAGIEFELASYVHATKTFKIILNTADKAWPNGLPNDDLKPEVGDKYTVFDINLPSSYITDAENRLLAAGQQYYDRYKYTQHEFGVRLTPLWVKQQSPAIELGHTVRVVDANLGIDKTTRIAAYTRDLQNEYQYDVDLSDELTIAEVVRHFAQQERILYAIQTAGLLDPEQMRKNLFLNRLSENDGYLYVGSDKVKSGFSDYSYDSDKWDGQQFGAFLDQPVRTVDSPTFQAVTANELNALQGLMIPQISNAASQALWKSGDYLMMGTNKAWSGNSDLWNGLAQPDYVTQPVRPGDSPKFTGVSSPSFASGFSGHGFRMVQDGNGDYILELDRLSVRKDFTVHELIVNKIRATNGSLWVSDAAKLTNAYASGGGYICTIDTDGGAIAVPFVVGDIVRCQVFNGTSIKYYTAQVTSVGAGDFAIYIIEGAGIPAIGDEIVRIGNVSNSNRQGALYLTSSDSGSPYLDVVDGVNSSSLAGKTKARLGKLDGIVDPDFGALSGYGLYAQNGFFKGVVRVANGSNVYTMDQTDEAIDAIEVGGRNLLTRSSNFTETSIGSNLWKNYHSIHSVSAENGLLKVVPGPTGSPRLVNASISSMIPLTAKREYYTLSFVYRAENEGDFVSNITGKSSSSLSIFNENGGQTAGTISRTSREFIEDGFIKEVWSIYTLIETDTRKASWLAIGLKAGGGALFFKYLKLEKGTKATDWTPAPEDVNNAIDTLRTETQTEFSVLDGKIESKVSQTDYNALNQRVGQAETGISQNAGQIALRATKTEVDSAIAEIVEVRDTRNTNQNPSWYFTNHPRRTVREFKQRSVIGLSGSSYCQVVTFVPWTDATGGAVVQEAVVDNTVYTRSGTSTSWSAWVESESTSGAQSKATTAQTNAISSAKAYTDSQITITNNAISLKADKSITDSLTTRMSSAEAKITPDAINLTVEGQIDSKVGSIGIWNRGYRVNTSTPLPLKEADGSSFDLNYTYEVTAKTTGTSTVTTAIAVFKPNGSSWEMLTIRELGLNSNHPEFFLDNGVPSIRLYGHTTLYWVDVRHEKTIGLDNNLTAVRTSFIMTNNSISLLGQSIEMTGKVTYNSLNADVKNPITTAQNTANTALSNANNANSNLSALQLSLGAMAYENVVGLAKLDSTVIDGGYIRTALLDVESIFAQNITATGLITAKNLTVTENSKIGGFNITKSNGDLADEYNRLENRNAKTSLIFENLGDASTYLRINRSQSDPILAIGTSQVGRTGLSIQTFANGATGLYILNNVSGGTGKAIASYGNHEFYTRYGESWNAPGVLAIMHTNGGTSPLNVRWKIGSLTFSLAQIVGGYRVSHNIGHTEYFVQPHINNINIAIGISAITSSYFEVEIAGGTGIGYQHIFTVIGRNAI